MRVRVGVAQPGHAGAGQEAAVGDDGDPGGQREPGIEALRSGRALELEEGHAEHEHAGRVHERDDGAEVDGVALPSPGAHEVGGHHRLAVAGRQGVPGAEEQRQRQHPGQDTGGDVAPGDQGGEASARPPGGSSGGPGGHRWRGGRAGQETEPGRAQVEGRLDQVGRVAPQLVAGVASRRARADQSCVGPGQDDDLPPPDAAGLVEVGERGVVSRTGHKSQSAFKQDGYPQGVQSGLACRLGQLLSGHGQFDG